MNIWHFHQREKNYTNKLYERAKGEKNTIPEIKNFFIDLKKDFTQWKKQSVNLKKNIISIIQLERANKSENKIKQNV